MSVLAALLSPHPPIVLPEIGRGAEARIKRTVDSLREVSRRAASLSVTTVVIVSPHAPAWADGFHISPGRNAHGDFGQFGASQVVVEATYDHELARTIVFRAAEANLPTECSGETTAELDHGTMVPLHFLQEQSPHLQIVRLGISGLSEYDHFRLGSVIAQACRDLGRAALFVASGDLSHRLRADGPYGYSADGPEFDRLITSALTECRLSGLFGLDTRLIASAGQCGLNSLQVMAGSLDGCALSGELLSYEGPFGVGYAVAWFQAGPYGSAPSIVPALAAQQNHPNRRRTGEDAYVRLARETIETFVRTGRVPPIPSDLPTELTDRRAGAFVSLHRDDDLRGCIGTLTPTRPSLAMEVVANAVAACSADPRFPAVEPDELDDLTYGVDVLSDAQSVDDRAQLDPRRFGVIVSLGRRRGVLLPDLEGVETVSDQIAIALRKAGIEPDEPYRLARFTVQRHR